MSRFATLAGLAMCVAALTACGGGGGGGGDPTESTGPAMQPARAEAQAVFSPLPTMSALRASVNTGSPNTVLTVRAYAVIAGNVGPSMQILVNGTAIQTIEVRATVPTDYVFNVPALVPGSKVDVVFGNDAMVNGVSRDLFVAYIIAADTYVLPNTPGVVYDRGLGAAAFDGLDTVPGQVAMGWSGAMRFTWPVPNLTDSLTVRARGTLPGNAGPIMQLRVDGVAVGSAEVRAVDTAADYTFATPPLKTGSKIDVVFTNDGATEGLDRDLFVEYLIAGSTYMLPTSPGVTYDIGAGAAAFDGANVGAGRPDMGSSGALRMAWAATNMTDRVTVRASGSLAGNVGPTMQLRVNGIVFGTVEVRSTTPADYVFAVPPMQVGQALDIVYTNDALINGQERDLYVDYAIAGKTYVLPVTAGVTYDLGSGGAAFDGANVVPGRRAMNANGALRVAWPVANMTDSLTVRARGSLAANVGPMMLVRVDGVAVGTFEVRSTGEADYVLSVPPMRPGAAIDVVFTNDANINGEDRNLFVSYLISGTTFILPGAPGNIYDRGVNAASFDGIDTLPGQGVMPWTGALRLTWPAPNITDTVVVRASGVRARDLGPIMQLRVDGVTVSSVEVRSSTATDHVMAVPTLRPGNKIDVVFANDAVLDGVDRNLYVSYLMAGSTFVTATSPGVVYDRGSGNAAFDGVDVLAGQTAMESNGALRATWPAPNLTETITVRASGTSAANVKPLMQVRVNGVIVGTTEVGSTVAADYVFVAPALVAGSRIDVAFLNDYAANGEDRNLYINYIKTPTMGLLVPTSPNVVLDAGIGEAAFDGASTSAGMGAIGGNGALRFTVPTPAAADATLPAQYAASRFLQQASFGPTSAEITRLTTMPFGNWITEQLGMPVGARSVDYVQAKYNLGPEYRPNGSRYSSVWIGQRFWADAATRPDQLRQRVAFALHHMFMISQVDANLWVHTRAYANYLDTLNLYAFGNFRTLLEEVALSPAMGIYLSHMRNRKEDTVTGRMPDENFAREVMQLFTIGLYELNTDGTPKLGSNGQPIETYTNTDVMALAKVFTGFSWAFPDNQLTEQNFLVANPDYSLANDTRIDLLKMKPYPGQHSTAEKRLFSGKPNAVVIPANSAAQDSVRIALDALFQHPNVGPFVGRQLIQRLVTSHPSPAYVGRVAAKFNNNGSGVRGDMAAVVRAVLLDNEALTAPAADVGKVREPVLRVAHWMRSFGATSRSGEYIMAYELDNQSQRAMNAPSVFGYFRPGYVPPNTTFSASSTTVPELQIVNESTTANWVNTAMAVATSGLGWTGSANDVSSTYAPLIALSTAGNVDGLVQQLNLLLFAGRMSSTLRQDLLDAVTSVTGNNAASHDNRARVALFLALASTEYLVQR